MLPVSTQQLRLLKFNSCNTVASSWRNYTTHRIRFGQRSFSSSTSSIHTVSRILKDEAVKNKKVTVQGWIRSVREQKSNTFVDVNDGSSLENLQIWLTTEQASKLKLTTGASVEIAGTVVQAPNGLIELSDVDINLIGTADASYPLQKKRHSFEYLREIAHLRPRGNTFGAVLRIRNSATMAVHNFFQTNGYIQVHTPILNASDCEGAGELFVVNTRDEIANLRKATNISSENSSKSYFSVPECYLTVSGQLEAEIFASSMSKVYTFGPTFRAEESHTPRHLSEFWMIEPEIAFADLTEVMNIAESFVKSCVVDVQRNSSVDLNFFNKQIDTTLLERLVHDQSRPYARMTYTDAVHAIQSRSDLKVNWGDDLARDHERWLCEQYTNRPVFVTNYPKSLKPFYMRLADSSTIGKETVECCDLLVPRIGELIGGSAREERLDRLINRMKEMKLDPEAISWYLDLRRYGSVPHGGFGMGFERFLLYLTGMENIRDVIPIPRHPGYCKF